MLYKLFLEFVDGDSLLVRQLSILLVLFSIFVSIYSLWFFIYNKIFLIGSDSFYYLSIADSIVKYGEIRDITAIPSFPIKSPQNGIVFVHVILSILGFGAKSRIFTILIINYLLYLSAVYPLFMIARWSGLRKNLPLIFLLAVYLGAWHIYRINLLAINDGIFNSLALWLVYFIMKFVKDINRSESILLSKEILIRIVVVSLFVILLVQFRLNASLIIGCAVISSLVVRDYRISLLLLGMCILLVVSFLSLYLFIEVVRLENVGERYFLPMFTAISINSIKLQLWKILPRLVAGLSGVSNPIATLLFTIFPLSMIFYGIRGLFQKNFYKVFISSICLTALWFTMSFQNARVIWYSFPFIYLIILSFKETRIIGYLFTFLVFFQSIQQFYIGFPRGPESSLWLYIYDKGITVDENALVSSQKRRHPYFFLGARSYLGDGDWKEVLEEIQEPGKFMPKLTWDLIKKRNPIFVVGDSTYVSSTLRQVNEIIPLDEYEVEIESLTPKLDKFKEWTLIKININQLLK